LSVAVNVAVRAPLAGSASPYHLPWHYRAIAQPEAWMLSVILGVAQPEALKEPGTPLTKAT